MRHFEVWGSENGQPRHPFSARKRPRRLARRLDPPGEDLDAQPPRGAHAAPWPLLGRWRAGCGASGRGGRGRWTRKRSRRSRRPFWLIWVLEIEGPGLPGGEKSTTRAIYFQPKRTPMFTPSHRFKPRWGRLMTGAPDAE